MVSIVESYKVIPKGTTQGPMGTRLLLNPRLNVSIPALITGYAA